MKRILTFDLDSVLLCVFRGVSFSFKNKFKVSLIACVFGVVVSQPLER